MNKTLILSILLTALCLTANTSAQNGGSGNVKTSIANVTTFGGTTVIPAAGSTVMRNNDGAFWNISTSGLTPGHAVTLWVAFFNNPSYCDQQYPGNLVPGCDPADLNNVLVNGSLQWAGGTVVGVDGRANFSGYLGEGDNTGFTLLPPFPNMPNPALGLINPKGADIHLVIRTHGPASSNPATLQAQLSSFGGGCAGSPSPCANIQASIHHP